MNERDLLKQTVKEYFLDKEQIRNNAICNPPVPKSHMKGTMFMKKRIVALISIVVLMCFSAVTVFAVSRMLNAKEVAQELNRPLIASAFEGENAIAINKTITEDGYDVTLLGITSGRNLDAIVNDSTDVDKSYAVVAVSNSDGTPIVEANSMFVSPLIKGLNPGLYNIATFGGAFNGIIDEGILYHMIECDSIEMFADRGIYLCVTKTGLYDSTAFNYDQTSGDIAPNPSFNGLNALFTLPIDKSKADPQKAKDYIDSLFAPEPESEDDTQDTSNEEHTSMWPVKADGTPDIDAIISTCKVIEESRQNIKPDANGYYNYSFANPDGNGSMQSSSNAEFLKSMRKNIQPGDPFLELAGGGNDGKTETISYLIYTFNADDSIDAVIYEMQKPM